MVENVTKIEISANTVAWYGAIVATLGFMITVLNFFRDRSKIKVKVSQGLFVYHDKIGPERQVIIEAINHGRRTVTMTSVGFSLNNGNKLVITAHSNLQFPVEIQEGKSIQSFISVDDVKTSLAQSNANITHAWYQAATGKVYRAKWKIKNL